MGIELPFSTGQTWGIVAACVLAVLLMLAGLRGWVSDRMRGLLSMLKVLGVVLLVLLFIKPFWVKKTLDPDAFRVVLLADLSASMLAEDRKGRPSRLEIVRQAVDATKDDSLLRRLREQWRVEPMAFAGDVFPLAAGTWETVSTQSETALGASLLNLLGNGGGRLGGVLLLSDGHDNAGLNMAAVAEGYRGAGVPVNVVGVGDHRPRGDLSVSFVQDEMKGVAREESILEVRLTNGFSSPVKTVAVLRDGDEVLGSKPVTLAAHGEDVVEFAVEPERLVRAT